MDSLSLIRSPRSVRIFTNPLNPLFSFFDSQAEEIGPPSVHLANGNVDILVESEKEAAIVVMKLLSYFQGPIVDTSASLNLPDQRILRHLIPKDRKRAYDVREIIRTFSDQDSFIEVGSGYGQSLVTGFLRIDGRPLAIIASSVISPLGGAIDTSSALKATRFLDMLTRTKACHLMVAAGEFRLLSEKVGRSHLVSLHSKNHF